MLLQNNFMKKLYPGRPSQADLPIRDIGAEAPSPSTSTRRKSIINEHDDCFLTPILLDDTICLSLKSTAFSFDQLATMAWKKHVHQPLTASAESSYANC
jgi:hypothetical protein